MYCASSLLPSGAGFSFFKFSIARSTMPLLGPSFEARSKRTTETLALTQWAAICAPMTPAPRTATFLMMGCFTRTSILLLILGSESEKVGLHGHEVICARAHALGERVGL